MQTTRVRISNGGITDTYICLNHLMGYSGTQMIFINSRSSRVSTQASRDEYTVEQFLSSTERALRKNSPFFPPPLVVIDIEVWRGLPSWHILNGALWLFGGIDRPRSGNHTESETRSRDFPWVPSTTNDPAAAPQILLHLGSRYAYFDVLGPAPRLPPDTFPVEGHR